MQVNKQRAHVYRLLILSLLSENTFPRLAESGLDDFLLYKVINEKVKSEPDASRQLDINQVLFI